jgi:hypothetical protein
MKFRKYPYALTPPLLQVPTDNMLNLLQDPIRLFWRASKACSVCIPKKIARERDAHIPNNSTFEFVPPPQLKNPM